MSELNDKNELNSLSSSSYRSFNNPFFKALGIMIALSALIIFFGLQGPGPGFLSAILITFLVIIGLPILLLFFIFSWAPQRKSEIRMYSGDIERRNVFNTPIADLVSGGLRKSSRWQTIRGKVKKEHIEYVFLLVLGVPLVAWLLPALASDDLVSMLGENGQNKLNILLLLASFIVLVSLRIGAKLAAGVALATIIICFVGSYEIAISHSHPLIQEPGFIYEWITFMYLLFMVPLCLGVIKHTRSSKVE